LIQTNIRGKNPYLSKKIPFGEEPKELHDCLDCEGCICEDFCREEDEKYFGREGDSFESENRK